MTKKLIEFVCTGNNGRSPVAELLARNHLVQIGASEEYDAASSGLMVDYTRRFVAGQVTDDPKMVGAIISIARDNMFYSPAEIFTISKALREGDNAVLLKYAVSTSTKLMDAERECMYGLLAKMGIPGQVKSGKDQTIARPDTKVVLAMDKKGLESVGKIYAANSHTPVIDTLPRYATGDDREVANAFGKPRGFYRATIEQLAREVPLAVDRAVGA